MSKTRSLLPMVLVSFMVPAFAQTPQWLWGRSGVGLQYDQASAVTTDAAGNVIAVGYFSSDSIAFGAITLQNNASGSSDLFVVKYDPSGNVLWARSAGGGSDDKAYAVVTDAVGNVYMAGGFYSPTITFGTFTLTNAGNVNDICVVKYDPNGTMLHALREGGPSQEIPYAIQVDDGGNIIVAGRFSSLSVTFGTTTLTQAGSMDVFVVKYDASWNVLWAKSAGGGTNDEAYALGVTSAGDVIVAGYFNQNATFGGTVLSTNGSSDIFLAKCDGLTGDFLWAKKTGGDTGDIAQAIALDASDNIYVGGVFQSSTIAFGPVTLTNYSTAGTDNGFIARYDANGNAVWARGLDARSKVLGVALGNNGVYGCGSFKNTALHYGSFTLPLDGSSDMFLLKSDLNGNPLWLAKQTAGGLGQESALAMTVDASGHLVVAGDFDSDDITFGPAQLINSNGFDAFVVRTGDPVGIAEDPSAPAFQLFPNPATSQVRVVPSWSGPRHGATVEVIDACGRELFSGHLNADGLILDVSGFAPGSYMVRCVQGVQSLTRTLVVR